MIRAIKNCVFSVAMLTFSGWLCASEFQHELLNENDGFSSSIIFSIEQDEHGFLWFGTAYDGILRYDGKNVVSFVNEPNNSFSLPHNNAGNLSLDTDGNIWVGSWGGGAAFFDYDAKQFKHYPHVATEDSSVSATRVQHIFEDTSATIWLGTYSGGLNKYDKESDSFVRFPFNEGFGKNHSDDSLSSDRIWDIEQSNTDGLWLGTSNGLNYFDFDTRKFEHFYPNPESQHQEKNRVRRVEIVDDNILFLGTQEGVLRFDKTQGSFYQLPVEGRELLGPIYSMLKTSFGDYWVSTDSGVYSFNQNRLSLQKVELGFDDQCSQTIFQDRQGTIWLSCEGVGIYKITKTDIFSTFDHPDLFSAFALHRSNDNGILVGTYQGGLKKWIPETNQVLSISADTDETQVDIRFITQTSSSKIWIANNQSVYHIDEQGKAVMFNPVENEAEALSQIRNLNVDDRDYVWVVTNVGIFRISEETGDYDYFSPSDIDPNFSDGRGPSITFLDNDNTLWAVQSNQLYRFDSNTLTFTHLEHQDTQRERERDVNVVYSILHDTADNVWLSNRVGLYQVDLESGNRTLVSAYFDEINNRGVRFMSEDDDGNIWLVTPVGVSRLNPSTMDISHFDNRDGLPGSRYYYNPTSRLSDGSIFLSSRDGIYYFNPMMVQVPKADDSIRLTKFEILGFPQHFNENELMDTKVELASDQTNIRFEFATLDILNARQIQYEYMLDGFDEGWIDNGTASSATYTNLSGGDYVFRVRARIKQNLWYENELALDVFVATPLWQRWWMLVVYAILILLAVLHYIHRQKKAVIELEKQVADKTADIALESSKLAAANRIKTQFLANMSHEIRTPLTTVIGQAEAIICRDIDPNDIYKEVEIIHDSSIYLLALLNDILDLTKIEENKFQLEYAPQDLHSLLNNINTMFSMQARVKGLSFRLNQNLPQPCIVNVDGLRLKQILINLLSNALKFTLKGHVTLNVEVLDNNLVFHVEDTGIGISEEQIAQIFGSFTQGDASIRRRFGGSGLGLHLSNQLAVLMNGKISVESEVDNGSVFTFSMPMPELTATDDAPMVAIDFEAIEAKSLFNGSILLAEDHEDNRRLISRLLAKLGLTVYTAKDGFEAVEHYKQHRPEVVLLDIQMPRMDGLQAYKELRAFGCDKPIIALTANAMPNEVEEYFSLGFDGYIQKPIDRKSLISTIATFFESKDDYSMSRANSMLGTVDMSDLVLEFTEGLQEEWAEFVASAKAEDIEAIKGQAHRLSGAAQLFGFGDLSAKATQLERNIKELMATNPNAGMESIQNDLEALKQSIERCFH